MTRHECSLDHEELISWREGTLSPERSAEVAVHVAQCPICQRRIDTAEEVDDVFQQHWPVMTSPAGHRATIAQIYGFGRIRKRGGLFSVALVLALLIPLAGIAILWPDPTDAGTGFPGLINAARSHIGQTGTSHEPVSDLPSAEVSSINGLVAPERLPLHLVLVGQEPRQDGGIRLQYGTLDGDLELRVNQGPRELWEDALITTDPRFARVDDTGVAWTVGQREGTVSALLWERQEVVFTILVVKAPAGASGGLELDDGLTLVSAFMEAQDQITQE